MGQLYGLDTIFFLTLAPKLLPEVAANLRAVLVPEHIFLLLPSPKRSNSLSNFLIRCVRDGN